MKPDLLTRDVGRLLLGKDLQCAQCHDDPRYDDYKQADYFGIFAFLNRLSLFRDNEKKQTLLAEKAEGNVTFTSVFTGNKGETNPRLPGGEMIADPDLEKDNEVRSGSGQRRTVRSQIQSPAATCRTFAASRNDRLFAQHRQPAVGTHDGTRSGRTA